MAGNRDAESVQALEQVVERHMSDLYTKRPISHAEAEQCAQRLINSHFRNSDHARVSIPARPDYDDDLVLLAYIHQQSRVATT